MVSLLKSFRVKTVHLKVLQKHWENNLNKKNKIFPSLANKQPRTNEQLSRSPKTSLFLVKPKDFSQNHPKLAKQKPPENTPKKCNKNNFESLYPQKTLSRVKTKAIETTKSTNPRNSESKN